MNGKKWWLNCMYFNLLMHVKMMGKLLEKRVESIGKFLSVTVQLALLLLAIDLFRVEEIHGFLKILPLIFFGFIIHACLPYRFRLPFFFLLTIAAIKILFGFYNGVWLVGIGLGLIAICHLPFPGIIQKNKHLKI